MLGLPELNFLQEIANHDNEGCSWLNYGWGKGYSFISFNQKAIQTSSTVFVLKIPM